MLMDCVSAVEKPWMVSLGAYSAMPKEEVMPGRQKWHMPLGRAGLLCWVSDVIRSCVCGVGGRRWDLLFGWG